MSTDILAVDSLNSFGLPAGQEQHSEQIYVLSSSQLREIIARAIKQAVTSLEARVLDLEDEVRGVGPREGGEAPQNGQGTQISLHQVVQGLQAENLALKSELEALQESTARERAEDRRRITRLESPKITEKTSTRAEKIKRYIEARPDHKATFETLRGHLGVDKDLLNDAVKVLLDETPGLFAVVKAKTGDKRKRSLVMLPR